MDNTKLGTNLASLGTDAISRQQAINTLERAKQNIHHNIERAIGDAVCEVLDAVENGIKQLPPIQPAEPKRGRWILDRSGAYCCSKCMEPCAGYVMMKPRDKFCKMCGAKMEVNNESN